jgi:type I restriction-modification system DNA methylase subunit
LAVLTQTFTEDLGKLVRKFEADKDHYLSRDYSEAQVRVDFITPFFKALGWDVDNEQGLPHQQRECLVERRETEGRPDYNFRLGGQTRFFAEAKACCQPLDDPRHIVQAKGYAWNTKEVFFVILTDFEEFRFYDASIEPDERKPDEGLLLKLKYTDYLREIGRLWEFSKGRVAAGSLEAMLPRDRRTQRLRIPVDEAFLEEMTGWREELAKEIHKNNPELTGKQLNEAVQRLLDRIVFIRIAEDRRIIEKRQLADAVDEWKARGGKLHIFEWLNDLFRRINEDFNGEIFKPHFSERLKVGSEVLAGIIERLYPPKRPYRFDVIGVELLGSIYERYLGKTIRPTAKQVRVEDKPEVRKAGGVYYTPKHVVDYIVKNTVGKLIEGKTPKQIESLRILDPACGSGSFLIGAFQCLIEYHTHYLAAHPREAHVHPLYPDLIPDGDGDYRLSVRLKARILRNNLYGVDIDPQAVEITMMSLYLKALEGEKSQLPPRQSLLPELKYNVMCGNSLVGPDVVEQGALFAEHDGARVNPFDWSSDLAGFGEVMKRGGFDCVLANPPYIRIQTLQESSPSEADYLKTHYRSAATGNFDIYVAFVEKGLKLLKPGGRLGFILPSKFFQTDYGAGLRELLASERVLDKVVDFGHLQVFDGPTTYTCLLFLTRDPRSNVMYLKVGDVESLEAENDGGTAVPVKSLASGPWVFTGRRERSTFEKIEKNSARLAELPAQICRGSSTGADDVFVLSKTDRKGTYQSRDGETVRLDSRILRVPLYATDFRRYQFEPAATDVVIFPYRVHPDCASLITENDFRSRYPGAFEYLRSKRRRLEKRKQFRYWYGYSAPRNLSLHDSAHLLVPLLANRASFSEFPPEQARFCLMASGGFSITLASDLPVSSKFVLALLNSKLLFAYLRSISNIFRGGWITCTKQYVGRLPIRFPEAGRQADRMVHDTLVNLVGRMLKANTEKQSGSLAPSDLDDIEREIATTDGEIDELVCRLYGITKEERRVILGDAGDTLAASQI